MTGRSVLCPCREEGRGIPLFDKCCIVQSEILNTFILDTKESLQRLQSSLDKFEETLKSILNGLKNISKTMQETSESYYGAVLNALRDKHEMEQTLLMMEKRLGDKDTEIPDLKSSLQLLKESLEQLRAQQNEQHLKLCEQLGLLQLPGLLAELQAFISAPRITSHVKDNVSQTSPDMLLAQLPYNSHQSVLNASPGSKDISTAVASQGKENVSIQQRSHILATGHDVINALCTCCSGTAVPAVSHEGCWLLIQEPSETTPSRKVIKRDKQEKGLNAMRHSQHYQPDIDNVPLQNHVDGHKKLATDKKMQSGSIGIKTKREKPKKCNQRKRLGSSRKEGNFSKSTNAGVKPTITRKGCSRSKKAEHPYRGTRDPDNSSLGPPVVCQSKKCQAPHRKAEKSKVVLQSHENIQHVPNLQGMSGVKKKVDLSCTKNNYFWACSSPESSLSPDQVKWFILSNNSLPTCATPAQQKTTKCCPLFFDSDYSD
ncbi:interactor of HORMAD1 protein 1 isoform X4 [Hemicordylus capensis]|uniref:interactor of HORMAD1 protein 1 isoform X4 n=1 Tax=Hemicordylus capensis TaxID=884348 RepID=UPI002302E749|nr:interactor of HORMAD1 protein 1 isoform X4 [Hemicordylus capensis]